MIAKIERWKAKGGRRNTFCSPLSPRPSPLSPRSARRGVLLLVVLALLAIFALIAVAFVVLTGHEQQNAHVFKGIDSVIDPPKPLLQQVIMQVLHGPASNQAGFPNPASAMSYHNLLEEMYGNEWVSGTMSSSPQPQIVARFAQLINVAPSAILFPATPAIPNPSPITNANAIAAEIGRRGGCVLTITGPTTSPCYGQSTRIVGISPGSPNFQIMAFSSGSVPNQNDTFVINGVPFSGTGAGWDSIQYSLTLAYDPSTQKLAPGGGANKWPVALLPNLPLSIYNGASNPGYTFGGANSDYTAADFQHPLLAAQVPNGNIIQTLPSLHRPALINYWVNLQVGLGKTFADLWKSGATGQDLCRKIMMRPIGIMPGIAAGDNPDHPNFDGSNPNFNPTWDGVTAGGGQWDVDNDGDGQMDSVWVDLGMPVRKSADGHLYKPLFAILCVDLDGRLNLNAHGSIQQADANYNVLVGHDLTGNPAVLVGTNFAGGMLPVLPRGSGFGPAEISLGPLLNNDNVLYKQLLTGNGAYQGRYGSTGVPGVAGPDVLSLNKWFDYGPGSGLNPYWDFTNVNNAGSYGSPPDPFGVGAVALDQAGRPVYAGSNSSGSYVGFGSALLNNPYEMNLAANVGRGLSSGTPNNLFSPSELERLLRPYDRDAPSLPARLAMLAPNLLPAGRLNVTTDSSDVPCPVPATPAASTLSLTQQANLTALGGRVKHVTDLLTIRGIPPTAWGQLLPPEMLVGLKMNINRPFGNGRDDLGIGVVDAPSETTAQQVALSTQTVNTFSFDGISDTTNPNPALRSPTTSLEARQREARYLYVLACLTVNLNKIKFHLGNGATDADVAQFLAQWAINVVDFRSRGSIMTPFDYDPSFAVQNATITGWNAVPGSAPRVWGCKRPELLISETLAFHDRRTEDTDLEKVEDPSGTRRGPGRVTDTDDPKKHDPTFDQRFKPQGTLIVELFNPGSPTEPRSGDLNTAPDGGVYLAKVSGTTSGITRPSPVWRMIIVNQTDAGKDPDDPDTSKLPKIERAVYFAGPTSAALPADGTVSFQPDDAHAVRIAPILPGRYAVIGPGSQTDTTASVTDLGFMNGQNPGTPKTNPDTNRRIELNPNIDPNKTGQVKVFNDGQKDDLAAVTIQAPTAVVITLPTALRFSISEPDGGYTLNSPDGTPYSKVQGYTRAWDNPLDTVVWASNPAMLAAIENDGRTDRLKVIHLQRLANPLLPYNNLPSDPNYNPYRTIDSMPIDLTAFNGIDLGGDPDVKTKTHRYEFFAHQRGHQNGAATQPNLLWPHEPLNASPPKANAKLPFPTNLSTTNFNLKLWPLHHSLGLLNDPFGPPVDGTTGGYKGDPAQPFPWLTWNNRPYVSPLELVLVPWQRSSQLLGTYQLAQGGSPYADPGKPFPQLTNFFLSGPTTAPDEELHRVLEYLGVPSPFVGTETWANPTMAASPMGIHAYHPPFDRISTYREPGRINLNTMYGDVAQMPPAWQGLMAGFPGMNNLQSWQAFVASRRGSTGNTLERPQRNIPTEFAHPFRSYGGAALVPVPALQASREIDATLLRESGAGTGPPLFQWSGSSALYNDTSRSPYFLYQGLTRLGNLVTTRSNVYAVWITVGYFEVTPAPTGYDPKIYPDGYTLGRELGIDTGENERHRAFYIIDRTLPVGFQRGQDLNTDKAILVNRFIE